MRWPDFQHGGATYSLGHLQDYTFTADDTAGNERTVLVRFSNHCFTRSMEDGDPLALVYPHCDDGNELRCFCPRRYEQSLSIAGHIAEAATRRVCIARERQSYAIIRGVNSEGRPVEYAVVFSLDPAHKGLRQKGIDLVMYVRSAHLRDESPIVTVGDVRFAMLIKMRMTGQHPNPQYGNNPKRRGR